MSGLFSAVIDSFIAIFIILDPWLGLAVFSTMTSGMGAKEKARQAAVASGVALGVLILFMFVGLPVLALLDIELGSFKVAGGLILLILGIQALLGIEFGRKHHVKKFAAVLIGTPLLCGPGSMTAITILSQKHGYIAPLIASLIAVYLTWLMLFYSRKIEEFIGERSIQVISRVMGLLLAALAIQFIKDGIMMMIA